MLTIGASDALGTHEPGRGKLDFDDWTLLHAHEMKFSPVCLLTMIEEAEARAKKEGREATLADLREALTDWITKTLRAAAGAWMP